MIVVVILTRAYHAWKIRRAAFFIVEDLKTKNAYTPVSAVDLPYAGRSIFKMGVRDHRPMALDRLKIDDFIGITEEGKYYLKNKSVHY